MRICVGITTKNRKSILPKAIESALAQDYSQMEVFVFDDGSSDGTSDLKMNYPTVKWERSEESVGLLEARNRMMRKCGADIFISLDDDAWFLKNDEVAIAASYFKENDKLGAIGFDILEIGSSRFNEVNRQTPVPTNFFMGAGHGLRLSVVKEIGYYVPFPVRYGHEEKDLGIQILDLGYEIIFLPGVHIWHSYTPVERNKSEQDWGFVINDLIYKFRRVPLLYLIPVLGNGIKRTLQNKVRKQTNGNAAIKTFFKLIPSEIKNVKRVKVSTYKKYRSLSMSYLAYRNSNAQNVGNATL